jgi:hypothetical protein
MHRSEKEFTKGLRAFYLQPCNVLGPIIVLRQIRQGMVAQSYKT